MSRIRLTVVLLIAVLVASTRTSWVCAALYWVNPGMGDWMDAGNWSPDPPGWGDQVFITNGGTAYVDSDVTGPGWIGSLTLGEGFGQLGNLELRPGGSLGVMGPVLVGLEGMGGVYQQGGHLQTDSALSVGVGPYGVGGYDLASGQVSAYGLYVGEMGLGQFDHRAGSVLVGPGGLQIGSQYQGQGTYNLSGVSQLAVEGDMTVGGWGSGTFNQDGGAVVLSGYWSTLYVGRDQGSLGSYQMNSGMLHAPGIGVGIEGNGSFAQDNGSVNTEHIVLGGAPWGLGTYEINGGRLDVQNEMVVGQFGTGTFTHGGGLVNIVGGGGGPAMIWLAREAGSVGRYEMNNASGQLNVQGAIVVGSEGNGEFVQSAGSVGADHLALGISYMGGPSLGWGTYQLSGGRLDLAHGMDVGFEGVGRFEQTGGTVNLGQHLLLASGYSSEGTYSISAGSLRTSQIEFGYGDGRLTISGTADVTIEMSGYNAGISGNNTGTLIVDGGSLTNYGEIRGVNTFILGSAAGTDGAYTSHNYTEIVENFVVGDAGRGQYVQAAGQTYGPSGYPDAALVVGNQATGDGTVRVEGGDFHFNKIHVGNRGVGLYEQTGPSSFTGGWQMVLGVEASGQGTLAVRDGTMQVYDLYVGQKGSGAVSHDGGYVDAYNALVLGVGAGATGAYEMDWTYNSGLPRAELHVGQQLIVGYAGQGTFQHDGGDVWLGSHSRVVLGESAGGEGTYNLVGPQPGGPTAPAVLSTQGSLIVGGFGTGAFNQGGGMSEVYVDSATVIGAGQLAAGSDDSAEQLRINVTSPKGTTAAALDVLMPELPPLMARAIAAAADRSRELSQ